MHFVVFLTVVALSIIDSARCKVYERCELARELRDVHEVPEKQIPVWVCIARHESEYNTSAVNRDSGDHGLFQISQLFWCSPPGYACGVSCTDLHDDNIEDDIICARRIYREHQRLSGDGFNAWVVYNQYCKDKSYLQTLMHGCVVENTQKVYTEVENKLPEPIYFPKYITPSMKPSITPNTSMVKSSTRSDITTERLYKSSTRSTTSSFKYIQNNLLGTQKDETSTTSTKEYAYTINKTGFKLFKTNH